MSFLLIGVLIIANLLLFRWITRSFIKPLNQLRSSAEHIKDGNLSFKLQLNSNDEVGQLSEAFESMRNQLQLSYALRQQDEVNRKELISNISHDLRTPITNIKGYIEGVFGNGDFQRFQLTLLAAKVEATQNKHEYTQDNGEQHRVSKSAYTAGKTGSHREQYVSNVFWITRGTSESDDREGTCQAECSSDVTADEQDDNGDNNG
ncbi:hypothetical protein ACS72_16960 [Acinetobacter sp. VT 511]|nr:hypothetical protein ACS72_16960 [Acinetobacter sp. VT 511]